MFKLILRLCCALALGFLLPGLALAQSANFKITTLQGDDVPGGIYNGSTVTLTIGITNTGVVTSLFGASASAPAGYAFTGNTCSNANMSQGNLSWSGSLAPNASYSCTASLLANTVTASDSSLVTACISGASCVVTDRKTYTYTTTAGPTTDMAIAIGASKSSVFIGDTVDYTLTASNLGRQNASNTNAVFNFPNTLSVVPKSCPGASTTGGQAINWSVGNVAFGTSATCVLTATALSGAGTAATVTANVSLGATMTDSNPANNNASSTVALVAAPKADLSTTIDSNTLLVSPGDAVTFTLVAANGGPQDATSTQLSAAFPAGIHLVSASCLPVPGTIASPLVWNVGTLVANSSQTCTVQATVNPTTATSLTSTATISSAVSDPAPANNSDSVTISVQQMSQVANLAVHLSGITPGHTYAPGEALHLTATALNTTPAADASGVMVTLHVPNSGGLSNLVASCGTFDAAGNLTWNIGTLIGGSSMTCSVSATVAGGARTIPVSVRIDAATVGDDLSQLMDSLLVPVNPLPRQISLTTSGAPTTGDSMHVVLSGDGSVALFQSQEPHLVASNANSGGQDIYRIGSDGKAMLETMDSSGHQLIGTSSLPAISGDGAIVAFSFSSAKALHGKAAVTGQMWGGPAGQPKHQIDTGMGGAAPNGATSGAPSVASSGTSKKLVFCSAASNLVGGDGNGARDVFVADPTNPALPAQLISTDSHGTQLPGDSCEPKISADGTKVVFTLSAPTLYGTSARQVVRKDLVSGKLEVISASGEAFANGDSSEPTINADGSVIAFTSQASNLDSLGPPVGGHEVFVSLGQSASDGTPRIIKRVRSSDGIVPNGASDQAQVSNDGTVLVMHTLASNFFGIGKAASGTAACGVVAMTMNFFSPAAMGSTMCGGQTTLQNPGISGDGTVVSFDSNAPQSGTASSNSNAYVQGIAGLNSLGVSAFGDDFSGQWFDANQSGQGLVIDVLPPLADNSRIMNLIWFVYLNGQPTWLLGAAVPHAGSGVDAGKVVVQMNQVGIYQGRTFPLGEVTASAALWGSITLTFADANTGMMSWTSSYPGFNSGSMAITHFLPVGVPANDLASAQVKACYSGNWKEPSKSGHGFEFEVIPANPPVLAVDWFAFGPGGAPVWLSGAGPISGNSAQMTLALIDGTGAQFPPKFKASQITQHAWGTITFTFSDATHAHAAWSSSLPGYGSGQIDLVPTFGLERRSCQ